MSELARPSALTRRQRMAHQTLPERISIVVDSTLATITVATAQGPSPELAHQVRTALLVLPHSVRTVTLCFADAREISASVVSVVLAGQRVARSAGAEIEVLVPEGALVPSALAPR